MAVKFEIPSGVDSFTTVDHTVTGTFTLDGYVINPANATSGQILKYNGSSFVAANETGGGGMAIGGAVGSGTAKSILFVDASGNLAQNNTNLFFNYSTLELQAYAFDSISGSDPLRLGTTTAASVSIGHSSINLNLTGLLNVTDGAQSLTFNASAGLSFFGFKMDFSGGGPTITSPGTYDLYLWRAGQNVILKGDNIIPDSTNTKNLGSASAQWKDGYFGGKIILDGYNLDLSAGAITNQVLQYDGSEFVASDLSLAPPITTTSNTSPTTSGSQIIHYITLTAARTVTGTTGGSAAKPIVIIIKDATGNASVSNTISFTPSSGTVDGQSTVVAINAPYGAAKYYCDGTNWWGY